MISRTLIGLSLCSWNANGLLRKINEFKLFVEKYAPDIILVQETKLRPIHNIRIANYTCYRNDRVADGHAAGGGTLAYKAWKLHGPQNLTNWTLFAQVVLDGCYAEKWPNTVFQVPDVCSICLCPMHWPEKTHCGHGFHLQCLLQHLDVSNTCPLFRAPNPLRIS
ncbi:hypothetical protein TNCV_1849441 [Trichonephila clavipes]|nr:hypothetical protein TNCV_1849441 [Trichonephila clavipes]